MKGIVIATLIVMLAVVGANAQTFSDKTPVDKYDAEGFHCKEYENKMLYAATNVNDLKQQQYLLAAEAYSKLAANGQRC